MKVISYGDPLMFGNLNENFECGRRCNDCGCYDDCGSECSDWGMMCPDDDCYDDCFGDD